jgi:RNA polymerase sigma factor (sigma-70 family)
MDTKQIIDKEKCYNTKIKLIRPSLLAYCRSRVYDKHKAEDITQDVLLILSKKKNEYIPNKSFFAWAFQICHFQIKAFLTKSKRNKVFNFSDSAEENCSPDSLGHFCSKMPFQGLIQKEKQQITEEILSALGNLEKKVFSLSLKGWSKEDIMYSLKINGNQYSTTKSRALKKAKSLFKNKCITNYKI